MHRIRPLIRQSWKGLVVLIPLMAGMQLGLLGQFVNLPVQVPAQVALTDPIARLQSAIDLEQVRLDFVPGRGYLDSVLKALDISPSSQTLVFSKTSFQADLIS
jgi:hypothetical protein